MPDRGFALKEANPTLSRAVNVGLNLRPVRTLSGSGELLASVAQDEIPRGYLLYLNLELPRKSVLKGNARLGSVIDDELDPHLAVADFVSDCNHGNR